jgi:hypothetical protein
MKKFTISGEFYAEDIDDAFIRLSKHFKDLYYYGEPDVFEGPYRLEVQPTQQTEKETNQ